MLIKFLFSSFRAISSEFLISTAYDQNLHENAAKISTTSVHDLILNKCVRRAHVCRSTGELFLRAVSLCATRRRHCAGHAQ